MAGKIQLPSKQYAVKQLSTFWYTRLFSYNQSKTLAPEEERIQKHCDETKKFGDVYSNAD